jgi:Secretion system C-terminal sorting domain
MKNRIYILTILLAIFCLSINAQTTFQKSYCTGNSGISTSLCGQQTTDGGFILGGGVIDTISDEYYIHLVKTNTSGVITQEQTIKIKGGNFSNHFMQQTADGGYIISNFENIVKIDASFNTQWSKKFTGGSVGEFGTTIRQTTDGGYIIASDFNAIGSMDYMLTKIDGNGILQWTKDFYNTNYRAYELGTQQTLDGGYISTGYYYPSTGGQGEILVIKTDASGGILWSETIGGTDDDAGYSVIQLSSGEYVITGTTKSFGAGMKDIFLIKINSSGNIVWSKTYGGTNDDYANTVVQSNGGGYIIGGSTQSFGNGSDILLIKTDGTGNVQWSKTYGGTGDEGDQGGVDVGLDLAKTTDGGFFVTSYTGSSNCLYSSYAIRTDSIGNSGCSNYQAVPTLTTLTPSFQTNALTLTNATGLSLISLTVGDTTITSQTSNCFVVEFINEITKKENLNIFPNPFSTETTLKTTENFKNATLTFYSSFGQLVKEIKNISGQTITLHRDNLPSGLYFIRLTQDSKVITADKLVITD